MSKYLTKRKLFEMIKKGELTSQEGLSLLKKLENQVVLLDKGEGNGHQNRDIAIIGMAGRYPFADDLDQFWENLKAGKDCVTEIPEERWDWREYFDPDPAKAREGKMYNRWGAFLKDIDHFDPLFFNISPKEAETMDPQERLFLEVAWEAMEDAGYTRDSIREYINKRKCADVGVFVGETTNTYLLWGPEQWREGNTVIPTTFPWSMANRVSYLFNFYGPSMPVDTACSSSLTAVHLACESIKRGECSMAIVGGVNLYLHPFKYVWLCQMTMLSKKGRCHTFGVDADGFAPGEGVGAIFIKALEDAERDGDNIYAVIKGTSVNHDGKTTGYTVPNPNAQAELVGKALKMGNIDARTISLVEAHGTGTELGDPIEIVGLTKAFREYTDECNYCAISSSKSNIGHLESGAGLTGLIKLVLQMKNRQRVPSLHSKTVNPKIDFANSPFYIQHKLEGWEKPLIDGKTYPRRAGVSSFGAGGVNAHTVLEEYERTKSDIKHFNKDYLFILSARNKERLDKYIERVLSFLKKGEFNEHSFVDMVSTSQLGREEMEERLAVICKDKSELITKLEKTRDGILDGRIIRDNIKNYKKNRSSFRPSKDKMREMLGGYQLEEIAGIWTKGIKIEWKALSSNSNFKKVKLPSYPFAKERCWIPPVKPSTGKTVAAKIGTGGSLHPLLGVNSSTLEEQSFSTQLLGSEFFLSDHVVSGDKVLPGVAYIEMARAAAELAGKSRVSMVKGIVWTKPVIVNDAGMELHIGLYPSNDSLEYEVYSGSSEERVVHGQGKVFFEEQVRGSAGQAIDMDSLKKRCSSTMDREECYRLYSGVGLDYGVGFRGIERLYYNESESLSFLKIPESLKSEASPLLLHPTLMDGALQSMITLLDKELLAGGTPYLPYTIGEVVIYDRLPVECYAYVTKSGRQSAEVKKFNVLIVDDKGRPLVEIKDFVVRAYKKGAVKRLPVFDITGEADKGVMELLTKLQAGTLDLYDTDLLVEEIYG